MTGSAIISSCGRYRYALWRDVGAGMLDPGRGTVAVIMLNPSTADATTDDATIRRCIGFARSWGFRRLVVGNVFAWRATDPAELSAADDPIGPENDVAVRALCGAAELIVCAWGAYHDRRGVIAMTRHRLRGFALFHLGLTKDGHPRHPLYVRANTTPQLWRSNA